MRITLEADYALRIIYDLAKVKSKRDAKAISEDIGVTLRFTLKILRKLMLAGLIKSYKGTSGGYEIVKSLADISMLDVITAIDGPVELNRCLSDNYSCARPNLDSNEHCQIHKVFEDINNIIKKKLSDITFDKFNYKI